MTHALSLSRLVVAVPSHSHLPTLACHEKQQVVYTMALASSMLWRSRGLQLAAWVLSCASQPSIVSTPATTAALLSLSVTNTVDALARHHPICCCAVNPYQCMAPSVTILPEKPPLTLGKCEEIAFLSSRRVRL